LDEPTVGLDVVAARSLRNLINNMRKDGKTVFLTTHYLEEADFLCDRIAIIVKGKIVNTDTPCALKDLTKTNSLEEAFIKITGLGSAAMAAEKGGGYYVAG
jgi:ABC-2 type transport system ATP-binding protein